jgi:hypothetical protein
LTRVNDGADYAISTNAAHETVINKSKRGGKANETANNKHKGDNKASRRRRYHGILSPNDGGRVLIER